MSKNSRVVKQKYLKIFTIAACIQLSLTCFFSLPSSATQTNISDAQLAEQVQQISNQYQQLNWFGGTVLVSRNGNIIHQSSYGLANHANKIPNRAVTKFNLGSIAKHFTAVLVLQQVEQGHLSLQSRLADFELGFADDIAKQITIQHLLDHRSGFRDIFNAQYRQQQMAFDSLGKKLSLLIDQPLLFEPGTQYKYSNYGYIILGAILEKITGKKYAALLERHIFEPLAMQNTGFKPRPDDPNQSLRYSFQYDSSQRFVGVTEHPGPDGGIESTAQDVLRFYRALFYSNKLLDPDKGIIQKVFAIDGQHWGAFGGGLGISAAVELDLTNKLEIVVLSNSDNLVAERISARILSYARTGKYAAIRIPPRNFTYQYLKEYGTKQFKANFSQAYQQAHYEMFIGRALNELGMQLIANQRWNEASNVFNNLVNLFPEAPQAYDSLAFFYASKGDLDKALNSFSKAIGLQADFVSEYDKDNYRSAAQ